MTEWAKTRELQERYGRSSPWVRDVAEFGKVPEKRIGRSLAYDVDAFENAARRREDAKAARRREDEKSVAWAREYVARLLPRPSSTKAIRWETLRDVSERHGQSRFAVRTAVDRYGIAFKKEKGLTWLDADAYDALVDLQKRDRVLKAVRTENPGGERLWRRDGALPMMEALGIWKPGAQRHPPATTVHRLKG